MVGKEPVTLLVASRAGHPSPTHTPQTTCEYSRLHPTHPMPVHPPFARLLHAHHRGTSLPFLPTSFSSLFPLSTQPPHPIPDSQKYPSFSSSSIMAEKPKCVLAYSGGLDTSVILVWLIEKVRLVRYGGWVDNCLSPPCIPTPSNHPSIRPSIRLTSYPPTHFPINAGLRCDLLLRQRGPVQGGL